MPSPTGDNTSERIQVCLVPSSQSTSSLHQFKNLNAWREISQEAHIFVITGMVPSHIVQTAGTRTYIIEYTNKRVFVEEESLRQTEVGLRLLKRWLREEELPNGWNWWARIALLLGRLCS